MARTMVGRKVRSRSLRYLHGWGSMKTRLSGHQYWRFEDGVLEPDYPRNISEGFSGIPDNVDAALALPAHSYSGRERAYFFKGTQRGGRRMGRQWSCLGFLPCYLGGRPQCMLTPWARSSGTWDVAQVTLAFRICSEVSGMDAGEPEETQEK
ncbi:hypothetical protein B4U80_15063, partial [Leptotrombidium deliense]